MRSVKNVKICINLATNKFTIIFVIESEYVCLPCWKCIMYENNKEKGKLVYIK